MLILNLIYALASYLVEFVTSGPVVALELKGSNAIQKWQTLLGPTDSATARNQAPMSIRAKFGTGMYKINDNEFFFFFPRLKKRLILHSDCYTFHVC